jgi:hypothetical protein
LLERTEAAVAVTRLAKGSGGGGRQSGYEHELLARLKVALETGDLDAIDNLLRETEAMPLNLEMRTVLADISRSILVSDFASAAHTVDHVLQKPH